MWRPDYAHLIDPFMGGLRRYLAKLAASEIPGGRMLDVCCGTGDQVYHYARRGLHASGIDLDPGVIRQRVRPADIAAEVTTFVSAADATALPFPDGTFDAAGITYALHEKPPEVQDRVVAEMRRVVKPGGLLIFTDYRVPLPLNPTGQLIRVAEFLAGIEHHRWSLAYRARGGLGAILKRQGLKVKQRAYLMHGATVVARVINVK
jgi:ubiquinone/menaquinone biosynthesis C-methylase UbiE